MDKRSKKKVPAKAEQQRYDTFWEQRDFRLAKQANKATRSARTEDALLKNQNKKENSDVNPVMDKKFVLTTCFKETEASLAQLGPRTLALFNDIARRQLEQGVDLKKDILVKKLVHALSRFLLLSRTYGWDKKYRPSRLEQVFNYDTALAIREWLREYTDHRNTRSTDDSEQSGTKSDSASTKRFKPKQPIDLFKVGDEDNSLTKTMKRYNCLILVGRPGIGKTSCVEAICHEQNLTLQTIDCSLYTSFNEIKKEYAEAVKSQIVDVTSSTINRQPGTLGAFFSVASSQQTDTAKKQESKVFVIANIEHFLGKKEDGDTNTDRSVLKNMLDFFRLSRFPFVIKMTKACRNLIDRDLLPEFDFIEYTRPNLDQVTSSFDAICRIESLCAFKTVKDIKRFKEKDNFQQAFYTELLEKQLLTFEETLAAIGEEDVVRRFASLPTFVQLKDFVSSFDFNLHAIVSKLNYLVQVDKATPANLDDSLWSLLNDQFIDEYRLRPHRDHPCSSKRIDVCKLAHYPTAVRALHADSFLAYRCFQNQMNALLTTKCQPVEHPSQVQLSRFLDLKPETFSVDLLEAQEEVYLATLGKRVLSNLRTTQMPTTDPEQFELFRLLVQQSQNTTQVGTGRALSRLRSRNRE